MSQKSGILTSVSKFLYLLWVEMVVYDLQVSHNHSILGVSCLAALQFHRFMSRQKIYIGASLKEAQSHTDETGRNRI